MRRRYRKGYVILLALLAVALTATAMFVLAGISNSLAAEANRSQAEAHARNLTACALTWAGRNRDTAKIGKTIELNVADLNIPDGGVSVTPLESKGAPREKSPRVRIDTRCRSGRHVIKRSTKYLLNP